MAEELAGVSRSYVADRKGRWGEIGTRRPWFARRDTPPRSLTAVSWCGDRRDPVQSGRRGAGEGKVDWSMLVLLQRGE